MSFSFGTIDPDNNYRTIAEAPNVPEQRFSHLARIVYKNNDIQWRFLDGVNGQNYLPNNQTQLDWFLGYTEASGEIEIIDRIEIFEISHDATYVVTQD